jgi:hypothetical protein
MPQEEIELQHKFFKRGFKEIIETCSSLLIDKQNKQDERLRAIEVELNSQRESSKYNLPKNKVKSIDSSGSEDGDLD